MKNHICCICGKKFFGWGNNTYPFYKDDDDVCCNECNYAYVIPARIEFICGHKKAGV